MRDWVILRSSDLAEMELMTIRILSAIVCGFILCLQVGQAYSPTHYTTGKIQGPKYSKYIQPHSTLSSRSSKPAMKQIYEITAYTAGQESTGKEPGSSGYGLTASGQPIKEGDCACDASIPFGTKLYIYGYGTVVCEDRGSSITNGRLDIYMSNLNEALKFGRKRLEVEVLP